MAANAATRKSAARKAPAKPRETAAQRRIRLASAQATEAAVAAPRPVAPGIDAIPSTPEVDGGAFTVDANAKAAPEERETLFYYAGAGVTIPKKFSLVDALNYAHMIRTQGPNAAIDWAMERALGSVGYGILRSAEGVAEEQVERCMAIIIGRIEGTVPDPK
jgi:hypothetical protein